MFAFHLLSTIFSNPAAGFRLKLGAFLPLPKGEGRGEGKVVIQILRQHTLK